MSIVLEVALHVSKMFRNMFKENCTKYFINSCKSNGAEMSGQKN